MNILKETDKLLEYRRRFRPDYTLSKIRKRADITEGRKRGGNEE